MVETLVYSEAHAVALQSDGKIVTAVRSLHGQPDFCLIRLTPNGSFEAGGFGCVAPADFENTNDYSYGMAMDNAGRAVVVGESEGRFAVARFLLESPKVSVSGHVTTPDGRGLRNATVAITDTAGLTRTVTTGSFGFFTIDSVRSGEIYVIAVSSKRYRFAARTIQVIENLTGVDFVGLE